MTLLVPSLEILESTDSTNSQLLAGATSTAMSQPSDPIEWGHRVAYSRSLLALSQVSGRGRRNSAWAALPGASLCLSISQDWHDQGQQLVSGAGPLSLCVGVVVQETLQSLAGHQALGLKWPNDVLLLSSSGVPNGKLAGILIEARTLANGCWRVVVGVGVNLCTSGLVLESALGPGAFPPAGLFDAKGLVCCERGEVVEIGQMLATNLHVGVRDALLDGWRAFSERYEKLDIVRGQWVDVRDREGNSGAINDPGWSGRAVGIAVDGGLLVQYGSETKTVYAADVSIRFASPQEQKK